MYTVNEVFEKVYVINLNKRKDRLLEITQKLNRLNIDFERIEAVDGYSKENIKEFESYQKLPFDSEKSHELEKKYRRKLLIGPGALGILKSYQKILIHAKKKNLKRILIFEDDAMFIKDFEQEFNIFCKQIENIDWKILSLGATQHVWNFPNCLSYPSKEQEFNKKEPYYFPIVTDGAFAMGLDSKIYDHLLSEIKKMNAPVDSGAIRTIYKENIGDCIVPQPNLVIADVNTSNIGESRDQVALSHKLKWDLEKYNYPFNYDLVSVIMPTYNAENTLEISVNSLLNQTYPNIEIIIQDDCSSDGSQSIGESLAVKNKNVFYRRNKINVGCYATRNNALRVSKGKFITVLDPDDIALKERIEKQVITLLSNNSLVCVGRILRSQFEIEELDYQNESQMMDLINSNRKLNDRGFYNWEDREIIGLGTAMFRREVFVHFGMFWEERFSGDAEILERIISSKLGLYFPINGENSVHSFLMKTDSLEQVYTQLKDVILVSPKMDGGNLTNKYKGDTRSKFEQKWREKLTGKFHYEYPRLTLEESIGTGSSISNFNTQKDNSLTKQNLSKVILQKKFLEKELILKEKEFQKVLEENEWYSRTYDHLPLPYLKVGAIFRRLKIKKGF
jgi:glycosyltransferase involved in cell wall biosynthesis/GR25 family glycosyltransferase involved in LPS biosynthesis